MPDADTLSEQIAKEALALPSALTPGYKATLDATHFLRNDHPRKAADRLRDAAMLEGEDVFNDLADRVEALEDNNDA